MTLRSSAYYIPINDEEVIKWHFADIVEIN